MDTLFHFLFPVITSLAAKVHVKHKIRNILLAGALTVLIDLDHFIGLERATFHNIFITILLPVILILFTFSLKAKYSLKGFSILLLLFLSSHTILDLFSGGVALFYPLSDRYYSINFGVTIPIPTRFPPSIIEGYVISSIGLGLLFYFLIILLPCLFLDDIIEIMEKKHESFRKALKDFFK
jgi:membrane-bound metal-dependent hydrolase YbcI (DUF457 family)